MARIRSIEDRIIETREKLRELQDRKRLRDLQRKMKRNRPRRRTS